MSKMIEAIDQIAACAKRKDFLTCLKGWMICIGYDPSYGSDLTITTKDLTPEQIKEIVAGAYPYPSRLNQKQIEEITKDYPFQLPTEVYELYQRGNGCLPIGLDTKKDWNSFDNYFIFPNSDQPLYPLEMCMERYQALTAHRKEYKNNIDPRWFPLSEFEDRMQVIIGSEKQQETSPLLYFYTDGFDAKVEWSSLTNMLSAWAEVFERDLEADADAEKIIWQRYGWQGH